MKLNKKEVVRAAISHKKTECIPYYASFRPIVAEWLKNLWNSKDLNREIGSYLYTVRPKLYIEEISKESNIKGIDFRKDSKYYRDVFGCIWAEKEGYAGEVVRPALREDSLEGYKFPEPCDDWFAGIKEGIQQNSDLYCVGNIIYTLIENAFNLRGMQNFLEDCVINETFAEKLLDKIVEYNLSVIDYLFEKNVDAIKLNDDWGDQRGVLIGKERWVRLIYPRIKYICEYIKKKSKDTNIFLHSDGNIESILGKVAEAGIEVINPVQPEVMNVYSIKKQFGDVFTLFGVISGQRTMPFGTPYDVINEIKDSVYNLSYNGGLILAPGIILCEDYPKENILAFIETCRNQDFS